jgi:hypothetical protein
MAFRVWASAEQAHTGFAFLEGRLGILPFTGDGSNRRRNTLAVLDLAKQLTGVTVDLRDGYEIVVSAELRSDGPVTPAWALSEAISRLAGAKRLIDMVESLQAHRHIGDARTQSSNAP